MNIETITRAFRGCGTSLEQVLTSASYGTALKRMQEFERLELSTPQGIARNAGIMTMSRLLNTLPEPQALEEAQACTAFAQPSAETLALIHSFGDALIGAATGCLPIEIRTLASKWKGMPPAKRAETCAYLMQNFQSTGQGVFGLVAEFGTIESLLQKEVRAWQIKAQGDEAVLPALYGMWNPDSCKANCQGKTQMLTAFATLAGAKVLAISPAICARTAAEEFIGRVARATHDDLLRRGLMDVDDGVREGIIHSLGELDIHYRTQSYHVGLAIELGDGTWFMLDPHGRSYGIIPDIYNLNAINELLGRYGVLPGLHIQTNDQGSLRRTLEEMEVEAMGLLELSREMELRFEGIEDILTLAGEISKSDNLERLQHYIGLDPVLLNPSIRESVMLCLLLDIGFDDIASLTRRVMEVSLDKDYLEHRKKSWLTLFHAAAAHTLVLKNNECKFLHPVVDVGNAKWHLAIAALNTVSQEVFGMMGGGAEDIHTFAHVVSDQTTIHNILACEGQLPAGLVQAAHQAVAGFAIKHPLLQYKLQFHTP